MRLRALAKINLGLDILRKREDGYHEVRMIMQTIQMYDVLEMRKEKKHAGSSSIYLICNLSDHCHSGIDRAYDRIGSSGCF